MAEVGNMILPQKVLKKGVRDMIRISDARMSGTAFGTIILHVTPEASVGGPLGLVRTGDIIELSVSKRRLDLKVPENELKLRRNELKNSTKMIMHKAQRGYSWLYHKHVMEADEGCDFDFLKAK